MELQTIHVVEISRLEPFDWIPLLDASRAEGFGLVERLLSDWREGRNRFGAPGERLLACVEGEVIVGICGVNREPDRACERTGRLRRLYLLPDYRGRGLASVLVARLITFAGGHWERLTVNCGPLPVGPFYERFGFVPLDHSGLTHCLELTNRNSGLCLS